MIKYDEDFNKKFSDFKAKLTDLKKENETLKKQVLELSDAPASKPISGKPRQKAPAHSKESLMEYLNNNL